jgi:hydroxymethylpyrimidine/phosphomethylpyrimidine kinase
MSSHHRVILCISGHDPSGGAGIQADIETCSSLGAHALTIITAHTVQDTRQVQRVSAVAPILLAAQLDALLEDCKPDAVKFGLLGDAAQVPILVERLTALRVPMVLDPVLRAGGANNSGANLVSSKLQAAISELLLPRVDVLTPNAAEARRLSGQQNLAACGATLLGSGARNILITGGDEPGDEVVNLWYRPDAEVRRYSWPRLPEVFHGAGCTLAAAIASFLARGLSMADALEQAQVYTQASLTRAHPIGRGRRIPGRSMHEEP